MRKYLKTVDFIHMKIIMFNMTPFLSTPNRQRIRRYMTLTIKVKVIIH